MDMAQEQNEGRYKRTWQDKWKSINSKFDTCKSECITNYRSDDKSKDSIEAVVADIWNLKEWLTRDPAADVSESDILAFLDTEASSNIRACGDIETVQKHSHADSPHREDTELIWEGSGCPVVWSVTRTYKNGSRTDHWDDAFKLVVSAIDEWKKFLTKRGLLY